MSNIKVVIVQKPNPDSSTWYSVSIILSFYLDIAPSFQAFTLVANSFLLDKQWNVAFCSLRISSELNKKSIKIKINQIKLWLAAKSLKDDCQG